MAFAGEIRRIAPRYYVQTTNKWFFVEPHLIAPLVHFLPKRILPRLVRRFTIWGLVTRRDQAKFDSFLNSLRSLDKRDMQRLFPDEEEKLCGMTKSLVAVRRDAAPKWNSSYGAPTEAFSEGIGLQGPVDADRLASACLYSPKDSESVSYGNSDRAQFL
jgi:hypothetical protein